MIDSNQNIQDTIEFKLMTTKNKLNKITPTEIDCLLENPLEYYLIDIDSPTVISDIVLKIQRISLNEFKSEVKILNIITNYEADYNLTLRGFIQVLNPLIKKYYNLLLEEKENLVNQRMNNI